MTAVNFCAALGFVWQMPFDSPRQGYHTSPGDPGLGTKGGVIEATWANAVAAGIVSGTLAAATDAQLTAVLKVKFWGTTCDDLPHGIDLLFFNGRMMSGHFPSLMQQCCGFMGADDVDNWIGPKSLAVIRSRDPETFIDAVSGAHHAYLRSLDNWAANANGWTTRLKAAQALAVALADKAPIA